MNITFTGRKRRRNWQIWAFPTFGNDLNITQIEKGKGEVSDVATCWLGDSPKERILSLKLLDKAQPIDGVLQGPPRQSQKPIVEHHNPRAFEEWHISWQETSYGRRMVDEPLPMLVNQRDKYLLENPEVVIKEKHVREIRGAKSTGGNVVEENSFAFVFCWRA